MENEVSWEYWTDHEENLKTTKFYLYRNPVYLGPDGKRYVQYSTYFKDPENPKNHISSSQPVAFGISVFFAMGLSNLRSLNELLHYEENFSSINLYEVYYKIISEREINLNSRSPLPRPEKHVILNLLARHMDDEKKHLDDSETYFTEFLNEKDRVNKLQLKKYVGAYINWLAFKHAALAKEIRHIDSLYKLNAYSPPKVKIEPIQPISISTLSPTEIIVVTEKILGYFNACFREQAFPDKNPTVEAFFYNLIGKDFEYVYQIHNDPLLLDPTRFKVVIKGLDLKRKRLQDILRTCFKFSKANSDVYFKHLETKRFEGYHTRYIEFNLMAGITTEYLDPPNDKVFNKFSNFQIGNFSHHIYLYLLHEVYYNTHDTPAVSSGPSLKSKKNEIQLPVINSFLDNYKHFEYIQVIENLMAFIKDKLEFQMAMLSAADFSDSNDFKKVEYIYELEIDPEMLQSNYFKRRCKEIYSSIDFNREASGEILKSTYLLAKSIFTFYHKHISPLEFDVKEKISLRYDQINGTITDVLHGSEFKIYTPRELAMFCNNVSVIIFNIFFQDKIMLESISETGKTIPGYSSYEKTDSGDNNESPQPERNPDNLKKKTIKRKLA